MRHAIILIGAALLLASCDSSTTANGPNAGGDDFPNALGRALALGMDSSKAWNGLDSANTGTGSGNALSDTASVLASARSFAAACVNDTTAGLLAGTTQAFFATNVCMGGSSYVHDSVVVAASSVVDGNDNANWFSSDTVVPGYSSLTTARPGPGRPFFLSKVDTGKILLNTTRRAGNWQDLQTLVASGGADGILGTGGDNAFWSGTRALLYDGDTTIWFSVTSAIAGAPVIPGTGSPQDSGTALVQKLTRNALVRKLERGLLVAFRDTTGNYPLYWQATTQWITGANRWQAVIGPDPVDSSFHPRDTVTVIDRFHAGILADSTRMEVRALLGPDPRKHDRDSLFSVRLERLRTLQFDRHTVWQFTSDNPVANGSESKSGTLYAEVDRADGTYVKFTGTWGGGVFTGTYTTPTATGTIVVARDGSVVSTGK